MKSIRIITSIWAVLLIGSCQTGNMSNKEDIIETDKLPIDGVYEMSSDIEQNLKKGFGIPDTKVKVCFEKGRAFYTSTGFWDKNLITGKVFLSDIKRINEDKYSGTFFPFQSPGVTDTTYNVLILVNGNNLIINTPPLGIAKVSQKITFELLSQ